MDYTVSQLMKEIDRSRPVTIKWVKRQGYKSTIKLIDSRELITYELTTKELEELKHAVSKESPNESGYEPHSEVNTIPEKTSSPAYFDPDKLLEFTSKYIDDMKHTMQEAMYYKAQVNLIETSESRKDNEIIQLRATIKQLESQIESIKKELALAKKRWKFF